MISQYRFITLKVLSHQIRLSLKSLMSTHVAGKYSNPLLIPTACIGLMVAYSPHGLSTKRFDLIGRTTVTLYH